MDKIVLKALWHCLKETAYIALALAVIAGLIWLVWEYPLWCIGFFVIGKYAHWVWSTAEEMRRSEHYLREAEKKAPAEHSKEIL